MDRWTDGRMDRRMDGWTDKAGCRDAWHESNKDRNRSGKRKRNNQKEIKKKRNKTSFVSRNAFVPSYNDKKKMFCTVRQQN